MSAVEITPTVAKRDSTRFSVGTIRRGWTTEDGGFDESEGHLWSSQFRSFSDEQGCWSKTEMALLRLARHCIVTFQKGEHWIAVAFIGLATAISAAWVEGNIRWLSDIRLGACRSMFWLDREICCGSRSGEHCVSFSNKPAWVTWSGLLFTDSPLLSYLLNYTIFVGVSVVLSTSSAWLCCKLSRHAAGSGISEVKTVLNGFDIEGALSPLTCVVKCVGLSLAVASGLSIGKEGPLVHVAACWAQFLHIITTFLKTVCKGRGFNPQAAKIKREWMTAAAAAGISVAFGAPLGGVLYALEEIAASFPLHTLWKAFFCAVVGALSIRYFDTGGTGTLALFPMDSVSLLGTWQIVELIPFGFIGLLGGLIGTFFIRLNVSWMYRKKLGFPLIYERPIFEVFLLTLVTAIISYPLPLLRNASTVVLDQLFSRCGSNSVDLFNFCRAEDKVEQISLYSLEPWIFCQLILACIIKFLLFVISFGTMVPAGCFVPSLMIGSMMGRLVGLLTIKLNSYFGFLQCQKCIHPGIYAVVGGAATLGGTTRVTISIVVIMFELTGGLSYIIPFMVTVLVAKWVSEALSENSISECYATLKLLPQLSLTAKERKELQRVAVAQVMNNKVLVIPLRGNTLRTFQDKVARYPHCQAFPVVDDKDNRVLFGIIDREELEEALQMLRTWVSETVEVHLEPHIPPSPGLIDLSNVVNTAVLAVPLDMTLPDALSLFSKLDVEVCPVHYQGRLHGMLTRSQLGEFVGKVKNQ